MDKRRRREVAGIETEGQKRERERWGHLERIAGREDLSGFEKLALAYEVGYSVGVSSQGGKKK